MRVRTDHLQTRPGAARWAFGLLLVALAAALAFTPVVQAQGGGEGVLAGQVVNGTAGAAQIGAGTTVNLYLLGGELMEEVGTTVTDSDGRFRFEGLDVSVGLSYLVEAVHEDVPYSSADLLQYEEGQTELEVTVTVYDTTPDDAGVRVDLVHIFAESFGQVLRISETHLFGSGDDRTYIGEQDDEGQRLTLYVPVPDDVVGFALGTGFHKRGGTQFFVSQGAATYGPRIRVGSSNEINLIRLIPKG